jgi:hypothetical protein
MSRTPARITQADVARAIRAAQQCGAHHVEIRTDKTIHVVQDAPKEEKPTDRFEGHPGYVYFVAGGPFIKIGWSMWMRERIAGLQTGNPYKLELLATMPGSIDTEREMHDRFKDHRVEGEWFKDCQEIRNFIEVLTK